MYIHVVCKCQDGETAIHAAAKWGNIGCIHWLLSNTSISPDHKSWVSMFIVCRVCLWCVGVRAHIHLYGVMCVWYVCVF